MAICPLNLSVKHLIFVRSRDFMGKSGTYIHLHLVVVDGIHTKLVHSR